jgi:hypothetical protein
MNYKRNPLVRRGALTLLALFVALPAEAAPAERGDLAFLNARDAFRNGERVRLARQVDALQGHPLQAWAEYWALRLKLDDGDAVGIADYLARHPDAYLAEKLRGDWLRALGKKADWDSFRRELPALALPDAEINCYAGLASGQTEMVRPLWLSGQDLPQACEQLVDQMVAAGGLSIEEVWQRVRRLFEAKRVGAARNAAAYLQAGEGWDGRGLESVAQAPARHLDKLPAGWDARRGGREVALFAVQRLARSEPQDAARRFVRIEDRFSAEERAYAWGQIAMHGQPNFYGNLADDELGRPIRLPPPLDLLPQKPANYQQQRGSETGGGRPAGHPPRHGAVRTDMRIEGIREWNWTLRGMDDAKLLAAAELANATTSSTAPSTPPTAPWPSTTTRCATWRRSRARRAQGDRRCSSTRAGSTA